MWIFFFRLIANRQDNAEDGIVIKPKSGDFDITQRSAKVEGKRA